jgi:4-diphosphocytidyl-2-C-methyl-D-erythritol kinase
VGRREDGYHLLESAFRMIDWCDTLRLSVRDDGVIARTNDVPGVPEETDLTVRAARLLKAETGCTLGANIEIDKILPMGGGLGGGSSDAACVLMALNTLWKLALSSEKLQEIGLKLGADVPFFIFGQSAFASGVGEKLQALKLAPAWYVVLVPPVEVPTPLIFKHPALTRNTKSVKILDFSGGSNFAPPSFRDGFKNDLEPVAKVLFPAVATCLDWLQAQTSVVSKEKVARMTGSGGCVFAEFESESQANLILAALPSGWRGVVAKGLDQHPMLEKGM